MPGHTKRTRLVVNLYESKRIFVRCERAVWEENSTAKREAENRVVVYPLLDGGNIEVREDVYCGVGDMSLDTARGREAERESMIDPEKVIETNHQKPFMLGPDWDGAIGCFNI